MRLSWVCISRSIYKQLLLLLGCYIAAFSCFVFADGGSYWETPYDSYARRFSDPKLGCDYLYNDVFSLSAHRYPSADKLAPNSSASGSDQYYCGYKSPDPRAKPSTFYSFIQRTEVCPLDYFWNHEESLCIKKDGDCPPGQLFNVRTFSCQYLCEGGFLAPTMAMCDVPIPECPLSGGELDPYSYPPRCAGNTPPPCPDCEPKDPDQPEPGEEEPDDPEGEGTLCSDPNDPACKKENKSEDRCSKLIGPAKERCNRDRKRNRCHELGLVYNPDKKECQPIIDKKVKKKKGQTPECTMTLRASDGTTYEVPCSFTGEPDPERPPGPGPGPEGEGEGISFTGPSSSSLEIPDQPEWSKMFDQDIKDIEEKTDKLKEDFSKKITEVGNYFSNSFTFSGGTASLPCVGETLRLEMFDTTIEFSLCLSDYEKAMALLGGIFILVASLASFRIIFG